MDLMSFLVVVCTLGIAGFVIKKNRKDIKDFALIQEEDVEKKNLEKNIKEVVIKINKIDSELGILRKTIASFSNDSSEIKNKYQNLRDNYVKDQDLRNKNKIEFIKLSEKETSLSIFLEKVKVKVLSDKNVSSSFQSKMEKLLKKNPNFSIS